MSNRDKEVCGNCKHFIDESNKPYRCKMMIEMEIEEDINSVFDGCHFLPSAFTKR